MFLPEALPIQVHKRVLGVKDSHNVESVTFATPTSNVAAAFWFKGSAEGGVGERERVTSQAFLVARKSLNLSPHDRVTVDGRLFEVEGFPDDHTMGPWWNPGCVVWSLSQIVGG